MQRVATRNRLWILGAFLLSLGLGGCAKHELPYLTDHSSLKLAGLSDGVHPWITLNLLNDPTETSLCNLRWSPNGKTLAYIDGNTLYTWNPGNSLALEGGSKWTNPMWSPDGQFIVVTSPQKTLVVSAHDLSVFGQYNGDSIIWWCGNKLCSAEHVSPGSRTKTDVQTFVFGSEERPVPTGMTLVAAAPEGSVLLAETNFVGEPEDTGTFVLLGMDVKRGAVLWVKPVTSAALKGYGKPDLIWSERLQMAAHTSDLGGGFDYRGYVDNGRSTYELKFASAANYTWVSGAMSWIGEELFAPMTLGRVAMPSRQEADLHFWNEIALFNSRTGELRSVATGLPFEAAAASDRYVALVVRKDDEVKIVVSQWIRDEKGQIQGLSYSAPKEPERPVLARKAAEMPQGKA
jgi:hypothetical protein